MIKGAIFDVDGVLIDSMIIWKDLGVRYLKSLDIKPEEELSAILFSMSMEQGAEYLKKQYSINKTSEEIFSDFKVLLEDFYFNQAEAKAGALETARFLKDKGIPMVAATSSPRIHVTRALQRNGLMEYIENVFTVTEIGVSKHEPDIFIKAAESMHAKPEETIVFEDSFYALETAAKNGFISVGVFDEFGESNQKAMRETSDIYVKELVEFQNHWNSVNK